MMIHQYLRSLASVGGLAGLLTAVGLILALLLFLPRRQRHSLRSVLVLFGLYAGFAGLASAFPEPAGKPLRLLALLFLLWTIARAGFLLFTQALFRPWASRIPKIFLDVTQGLLYLTALAVTLARAGFSTDSLLTSSVVVSAILAIALRDTVGNVLAGLALRVQNAFVVGDWIAEGSNPGLNGKIREINWRATCFVTLEKVEVTIPHSRVSQGDLINITRPERYTRRSIYFHAAQDVSPHSVREAVLAALPNTWGVLDDPPPSLVTLGFDERGILYWLRFFISEIDRRNGIDSAVRDRVWYALARAGITIPEPRREVESHTAEPLPGSGF